MQNNLFFLGIDSATWDLIDSWVKAGKLPGFAKLLKRAGKHVLQSTNPPLTPVAWTSLYTGANAGQHGIYDFYRFEGDHSLSIYTASDNQLPTIFELLSKRGKRVCVANLPFTYPVRPVNGIMLGGFLSPDLDSEFIYPAELKSEFKQRFPTYRFTESARYGHDRHSQERYFQELVKLVRLRIKVFDWLEAKDDWDLFAVNFMEVDHVQHWFFHQPEKMLRVYQEIDHYLLKKLNQKRFRQYLVFSDHGAGPYELNLNLNTYFLQKGLLKLKNNLWTQLRYVLFRLGFTPGNLAKLALRLNKLPGSKKGRDQAKRIKLFLGLADINWQTSTAFAFGYYGHVHLVKHDKLSRQAVLRALEQLALQGRPVITGLWSKKEVYQGAQLKNAPDILYSAGNYAYGASAISPFLDNQVFSTPHTLKSGEHRPEGILAFKPKLTDQKQINIYELSATILAYFGIPIPDYFDAQPVVSATPSEVETVLV